MKEYFGYGRSRSSTDSNMLSRHFNPYVNCIHTQTGHCRENMEVLVAELDMSEIKYIGQMSSSQNSRVIAPDGISYAVTNGHKDGEPKIIEPISYAMRGRNPEVAEPTIQQRSHGFNKGGEHELAPTITGSAYHENNFVKEKQNYRTRKLTPREAFRLMGVSESDIDKIQQSGVSQSQQYKMAGNSIVVDCLYHIFRKMFVETGQESQQLSLF